MEPEYIDMKNYPVKQWCKVVADNLPEDEYIHFGLDDYLPIDHFKEIAIDTEPFSRLAYGWGCSKSKNCIDHGDYIEYSDKTNYSVSCQFSIWNTQALKAVLLNINGSPWDFEVKGKCKALALKKPAFRWIEESALSKRQPGKVNVLGLRPADVDELVSLGYLNRNNLIYGWGGETKFTMELAGPKYREFYE